MSITRVARNKYRVQVYDQRTGRNVSVGKVLGGSSYRTTKKDAKQAREQARELLARAGTDGPTVKQFAYRWRTDRLFARPKGSTDLQNHWAVKEFVDLYGHMPIAHISHTQVADYLAGGNRIARIPALRAMFNDAASAKAGRLVTSNPFAKLGITRTTGNRNRQPPSEQQVQKLIAAARAKAGPAWAAWLQVACYTGLRHGELDGLRWEHVDFASGRIHVREQFNGHTRSFTAPKNGLTRPALLTPPAREALLSVPRTSEFCFQAPRGGHYTPAARRAPWARTREHAGYDGSLYLATRHFAGWYMVNILVLDSEDVAFALGHEDGGELVRRLYGHRSREDALKRAADAFHAQTAHQTAQNRLQTVA